MRIRPQESSPSASNRATVRRMLANGLVRNLLAASVMATCSIAALPVQAAGPAYTWKNVKIGGSGYVTGVIAHPKQQGLFYARTDVGGSYRYDSATSTWIPLNDWAPPNNANMNGIEAIAIDPNDASKLYMVGGMYFGNGTGNKATFLLSTNQGASFTQVPLSFSTGGNQAGRQVNGRLQVDPNKGSILFYGTANAKVNASTNGLWMSTNGGNNWSKVPNFPVLSSDDSGAGVSFVALYKPSSSSGNATKTLFAGINTRTAGDNGMTLYRSDDYGNTWSVVWGGPSGGMLPQNGQIGPDGNLYITYSHYGVWTDPNTGVTSYYYGPDGLSHGQVWKYNVASGSWSYITPPNNSPMDNNHSDYGFVGLSVDPNPARAGTVVVNTMDRYDAEGETMFRTTDGGATWTDIQHNASFDASAAPWTTTYAQPHNFGNWGGSVLDPFDPNHAFVTFGGGIWETKNLTAASTNWAFGENGVEETAVRALLSPTANQYNAYPLLSGNWDICGFTHYDVNVAPQAEFTSGTCSRTTGLDYAKSNSTIVVRVGEDGWNNNPNTKHYGAISWNGGYSWSPFASNGPSASGGGYVAVSQDSTNNAVTILWSPPDTHPVYSTNAGYTWNSLNNLPIGVKIVADGYNPNVFYAYDCNTGAFYASGDKAVTWYQTNASGIGAWGDQLVTPPGQGGDVWLVNWSGLYRSTSSGWGAWARNQLVTSATALGFGKAAPGSSYPTMYLTGTIGGLTATYRSTDVGNTWVRIDDDQHQWGASGVITGDPKTFGTVYIGTATGRGIITGTSSN